MRIKEGTLRGSSNARRELLRQLVDRGAVKGQKQAQRLLARRGHAVTQATVSRDLAALGAAKALDRDGRPCYVRAAASGDDARPELVKVLREFVLDVAHSGNLALLRTAPGSAPPVAWALDRTPPNDVLGTIAGDDTVLVVARTVHGGARLARRFQRLLGGHPS